MTTSVLPIPKEIFRAYDIRGIVGETLCSGTIENIGQAIGSEAIDQGQQNIIIARDGRLSSPALSQALARGLCASGIDVIDIGDVPTPLLYFATATLDSKSGVMLTGSHNPANYNGLKMVIAGKTLANDDILALRERLISGQLHYGQGKLTNRDIQKNYLDAVRNQQTKLAKLAKQTKLKVVIDCGSGIAGKLAPELLRNLGYQVIELYCEVDGRFPHHHPDPSDSANLQDLINTVCHQGADLGLAFDGDGDRLGVVTNKGEIIWPDRLLMLFAQSILAKNPKASIIFDVKCTRHLPALIKRLGGTPIMYKTGHSLIKAKLAQSGALLAGEMSGHIFFNDRWYGFDDALYSAARLLEILAASNLSSQELFKQLPNSISTPELKLHLSETEKFKFIQNMLEQAHFPHGEISTIDGLRVDFQDGWGLARASNTTPCLIFRFEADNAKSLDAIQNQFRSQINRLQPDLSLPF